MKRIPNTLGYLNIGKKISFHKFLQSDSSAIKQRSILIQLNYLHSFLVESGILVKPKSRSSSDYSIPSMEDIFNLHLQQIAVLDRTNKTFNLVYHAALHNQMTKVLLLALFDENNKVVQKIILSGYPQLIFKRCIPLYLYFCATGNRDLMSLVSYKSIPFFGLGANILYSFKGLTNLSHIDYDFMTIKQFLLFSEYKGVHTIDKKVNLYFSGFSGYSSDSSFNTSNTETESSENEDPIFHSHQQFEQIKDQIDHKVLFPLDFLCIRNDFRAVDALLQNSPDFASLSSFCFLLQCHAGITLKLLQYRADPNQSFREYTPLHIACRLGNLDVSSIFIALNADLEAKDFFGRTPLYYAKLYQNSKIIELLEQSKKKKLLPFISTDVKFINYRIFEDDAFRERLRLTKEHLKRAMNKQYNKRFMIVSLFSLSTAMKTTQNHIRRLERWRDEHVIWDPLTVYEQFKSFLAKR